MTAAGAEESKESDPMTQAKALLDAGKLGAAIEEVTREVKASPSDTSRRALLFELLCFAGDWDRAEKQLDVIGHQSAQAEIGVQVYRNCIKAERARRRLFADGLQPHFLAEPPAYVDLHLDAINRLREGNMPEARATLDRAEEERPAIEGRWQGDQPFEDFRDYDDLVGPVFELFVQDKYTWLPIEQTVRVEVAAPTQLRDLVWATVNVETRDKAMKAFMPVIYARSSEHADDMVKLGRMTDWKEAGEGLFLAAGLRLFLIDGEEKSVFELGNVEFAAGDSEIAPPIAAHSSDKVM